MADTTVRIFDQKTGNSYDLRLHDNGDGTYSYAPYSAGSGGGAVTIADGANVAQGSTGDAAYTSGAGTVVAILKAVFARLRGGQATMANSLPVVVSSDQSAVPVSSIDGGQVTIGAQADAAYTSGAGTVVSILKGIFAKFSGSNVLGTVKLQDAFGNNLSQQTPGDALTGAPTSVLGVSAYNLRYNGSQWQRERVPNVFKPISLTAATAETTIWTPAAGKKFRILGFLLTPGAASTLTFKDNTGGTTILVARGNTDTPIVTPPMGDGILSAAANNALTVTRGTSCTLDGFVFGVEE